MLSSAALSISKNTREPINSNENNDTIDFDLDDVGALNEVEDQLLVEIDTDEGLDQSEELLSGTESEVFDVSNLSADIDVSDDESDEDTPSTSKDEKSKQSLTTSVPEKPSARGRGRRNQSLHPEPSRLTGRAEVRDFTTQMYSIGKNTRFIVPSYKYMLRHNLIESRFDSSNQYAINTLFNYNIKLREFSIIIDPDDAKGNGFKDAREKLMTNNILFDQPKAELWHYGLKAYPVKLKSAVTIDLTKIMCREINDIQRPYWLSFKSISFIKPSNDIKNFVTLDNFVWGEIAFGSLNSIATFKCHPQFTRRKESQWSFFFTEDFFDIGFRMKSNRFSEQKMIYKYRVPAKLIDRSVIFKPEVSGFRIFINLKGNILQYRKTQTDEYFVRQGLTAIETNWPFFSTIQINLSLKSEECFRERTDETASNREASLQELKNLFHLMIQFYNQNRIQIIFSHIGSGKIHIERMDKFENKTFTGFLKNYAWRMFWLMNFRVQVKIYSSRGIEDFFTRFETEDDEKFYRFFLYLYRRMSEKYFLSLDNEIEVRLKEIKDREKFTHRAKTSLNTEGDNQESSNSSNVQRIPSVIITPTTIVFRPLKLCKMNRVLREPNFGGRLNFALVELRDEGQMMLTPHVYRALKSQILRYLTTGFLLNREIRYKYLHHSQSQIKAKQFWFYHHQAGSGYLSHADAYVWMGNFDKERVIAKHTARIALCFTSSDKSIQVPAEKVAYVRDITDPSGTYTFSDGVGTISEGLRDQVQEYLGKKYAFSVLQIRYGGCKGTLSVDWRLNNKEKQMRITDSMKKFISDHDTLEICKLSAPRFLYLNRQAIVLLESRAVEDSKFFTLQNQYHYSLIRAVTNIDDAYLLLKEKVLPVFEFENIALNFDIINDHFFKKILVTCVFNILRELIDRTRIYLHPSAGRNMFGIVDEYGVLEYGQVFFQYTMRHEKKLSDYEDRQNYSMEQDVLQKYVGPVVITKNPCHHPGDLRVFQAVYHEKLAHLKDCIVFPQKGPRPHPNEISGSDLDGDEYVVIWDKNLIPTTPNEDAYDYDSQGDPPKVDHPITRDEIVQLVMEVSEQDCLGSLSNIHLAYVDRDGITSEICKKLAGYISQEVDAAKTGKHPVTEDDIKQLRKEFGDKWPDFMKNSNKNEVYPSKRILGKLYRSARRAVSGWGRAIKNYCSEHHVQVAEGIAGELKDSSASKQENIIDEDLKHPNWRSYLEDIRPLHKEYCDELLEIVSVYRFHDEIDLFARCESMEAGLSSKKNPSDDSAATEVANLTNRIRNQFYKDLKIKLNCNQCNHRNKYQHRCDNCVKHHCMKASCAYVYTYELSSKLPKNSNRRILSFAWLFEWPLYLLKRQNSGRIGRILTKDTFSPAIVNYLKNISFSIEFKFLPELLKKKKLDAFYFDHNVRSHRMRANTRTPMKKSTEVSFQKFCFVEVLGCWLRKQNIFSEHFDETAKIVCISENYWKEMVANFFLNDNVKKMRIAYQESTEDDQIAIIRNEDFSNVDFNEIRDDFNRILAEKIEADRSNQWTYLEEYVYLAYQCIAIEQKLLDNWI